MAMCVRHEQLPDRRQCQSGPDLTWKTARDTNRGPVDKRYCNAPARTLCLLAASGSDQRCREIIKWGRNSRGCRCWWRYAQGRSHIERWPACLGADRDAHAERTSKRPSSETAIALVSPVLRAQPLRMANAACHSQLAFADAARSETILFRGQHRPTSHLRRRSGAAGRRWHQRRLRSHRNACGDRGICG